MTPEKCLKSLIWINSDPLWAWQNLRGYRKKVHANSSHGGPPGAGVMTTVGFYVGRHFPNIQYFNLCGGIWRYIKLFKSIWRYMKVYESIWRYMNVYKHIWTHFFDIVFFNFVVVQHQEQLFQNLWTRFFDIMGLYIYIYMGSYPHASLG